MVNRPVGYAHYGLRDWLAQRITAIVMLIYTLLLTGLLLAAPAIDYAAWRQLFAPQWMKLATLLFLLSVYLHAWVGMRNIFMDYVKHGGVRLALYAIVIAALIAYTGWSAQILWSI
jgi:succinate dehydrogenase / fumarate reductase, membrane anchor subunit